MRTILILLVPLMLLGQTGLDIARKIDQRAEPADLGSLVIISMVSCAIGTLTILAAMVHLMRGKITA